MEFDANCNEKSGKTIIPVYVDHRPFIVLWVCDQIVNEKTTNKSPGLNPYLSKNKVIKTK